MNITDKAIEVMKIELECVKQNGKCNQSCEECNLIYKCDELVEVYEWVIDKLEWEVNTVDILCKVAKGYFLSEEEEDIINNKLKEAVNSEELR